MVDITVNCDGAVIKYKPFTLVKSQQNDKRDKESPDDLDIKVINSRMDSLLALYNYKNIEITIDGVTYNSELLGMTLEKDEDYELTNGVILQLIVDKYSNKKCLNIIVEHYEKDSAESGFCIVNHQEYCKDTLITQPCSFKVIYALSFASVKSPFIRLHDRDFKQETKIYEEICFILRDISSGLLLPPMNGVLTYLVSYKAASSIRLKLFTSYNNINNIAEYIDMYNKEISNSSLIQCACNYLFIDPKPIMINNTKHFIIFAIHPKFKNKQLECLRNCVDRIEKIR